MITWALIGSAVIALVLVVLVQGKWTTVDSWFAAVFASAVMAMVIDHYVAVATNIALSLSSLVILLVECRFLDNRFVVTAITSAEVKV
jgi:hypothetical protein